MSEPDLSEARERARAAATAAYADLHAVITALQERLRPANLAGDAVNGVRRVGAEMANEAVDAVRSRPVAASAVAAGVGALIGMRLFRRRKSQGD